MGLPNHNFGVYASNYHVNLPEGLEYIYLNVPAFGDLQLLPLKLTAMPSKPSFLIPGPRALHGPR